MSQQVENNVPALAIYSEMSKGIFGMQSKKMSSPSMFYFVYFILFFFTHVFNCWDNSMPDNSFQLFCAGVFLAPGAHVIL